MKAVISLHPTISQELWNRLGVQVSDYRLSYILNGAERDLSVEPLPGQEHLSSQMFIKDDAGYFNVNEYDLKICREIIIQFPSYLFGFSGVAAQNAEIGTALMWSSKPSNQRGIFEGESFKFDSSSQKLVIQGEFPRGLIKDRIQLKTILYLKSPGTPSLGEEHLARVPGFLLGNFGEVTIHLRGSGSLFPIFTLKEKGPLWRLECNWQDPRSDAFDDESVRIIINEGHPDYKYLELGNSEQLSPLMREIVASSLQMIIKKVIDETSLSEVLDSTDFASGSLCMAVQYFIRTFNLDMSSDENLAYSLRLYLDRRLKQN
jgi:hypothetical protein